VSASSKFPRSAAERAKISTVPDFSESLAKVPIFSDLTAAEMSFLVPRVVTRQCAPGELIFAEGDACAGLYVVHRGHIRIFKSSASGREQVLSIDGPGNSVAELPVFDCGPYPASASAMDEATILLVRRQDFHALCLAHPQVALKVLRVVGARLRRLVGIIEELSFTTVRRRLASFLFRLAQREGLEVTLPATGQEVAPRSAQARVGVAQPVAARAGGAAHGSWSSGGHPRSGRPASGTAVGRVEPLPRHQSSRPAHPEFSRTVHERRARLRTIPTFVIS